MTGIMWGDFFPSVDSGIFQMSATHSRVGSLALVLAEPGGLIGAWDGVKSRPRVENHSLNSSYCFS